MMVQAKVKDGAVVMVEVHPVRRRRLEEGWSLRDLARRSGLSREHILRLEQGKVSRRRGVDPRTLGLLSAALDVDPEILLEEIDGWGADR